jgi:two-component system, chemotaxis family, protein-glutamate methylesterase/glutaminase
MNRVRVVVVEDSMVQRARLVAALQAEDDIEVVASAGSTAEAFELVRRLRPDVVTVDLDLPGENGLVAIERIMAEVPTPILVLSARVTGDSSADAVESLLAGAVEALPKPERWDAAAEQLLRGRIRLLANVTVVAHPRGRRHPAAADPVAPVVGIGASTGGPAALAAVLPELGGLPAPVVVVQHLHVQLVKGFVDWMGRVAACPVVVAEHGERLQPGVVYIAPAGRHTRLGPDRRLVVETEPERLHRPSADELFASLAGHAGPSGVGVLLTGMGEDGATGLLELRRRGGATFAQDEASSVVFGMPAAAQRLGAATEVLPLAEVPGAIRAAVARLAAPTGQGRRAR